MKKYEIMYIVNASLDDAAPVSYTHLDVYKRQAQKSAISAEDEALLNDLDLDF